MGLDNLDKEKYLQAQLDFKHIVIRGTGSDLGDDAQYYLGEAYFRNEEYLEAVAEYEKLTRRMGFSPFVEDARFKICEAYRIESPKYFHDQEYTEKALERYQEFLDDYPNSKYVNDVLASIEILREKMGLKLYETGILYMKMEEYESAKMTFERVVDHYYDTAVVHQARQGMVKALAQNRQIDEALALLDENEMNLTEHGLYNDAKDTIQDVQKMIEKGQ
jgi:outer membrane protein assembly factor BamD